ncbi:MAG TPA: hypothetical protein VGO62_13245, partial [Myxococcota bacterium]
LDAGWTVVSGAWSVSDGAAHATNTSSSDLDREVGAVDVAVETNGQVDALGNTGLDYGMSGMFRAAVGGADFLSCGWRDDLTQAFARFDDIHDGSNIATFDGANVARMLPGTAHLIRATMAASAGSCDVDNGLTHVDASNARLLTQTRAGIRTTRASATFTYVAIYALGP